MSNLQTQQLEESESLPLGDDSSSLLKYHLHPREMRSANRHVRRTFLCDTCPCGGKNPLLFSAHAT